MHPGTDNADLLLKLAAIELWTVEIEARQRVLDESARRLSIQSAERPAASELQRGKVKARQRDESTRRLDLQNAERLAVIELQKEERLVAQREKKSAAERELSLAVIERFMP